LSPPPKPPEPETELAKRLEYVRTDAGIPSLRQFREALRKSTDLPESGIVPTDQEGKYLVSYEAVRNYHYDRAPPIHYLLQVAEAFSLNLDWVATGRPPIRRTTSKPESRTSALPLSLDANIISPEEGRRQAVAEVIAQHQREAPSGDVVNAMLSEIAAIYIGRMPDYTLTPELALSMADDLVWLMELPGKLWGFQRKLDGIERQVFYFSFLQALRLALNSGRGDGVMEEYEGSLIHRLRRCMDDWRRGQEESSDE
jgi:hypothetical protein